MQYQIHRLIFVTYAITALTVIQANAMDISITPNNGSFFIEAAGAIEAGDRVKLVTAMDKIPLTSKLIAVAVSSPGGSIFEAEKMAVTIRSSGVSVVVPPNRVCASACFLLFAAATRRYAFPSSLIGVHSASENGQETLNSMGFTTALARDAASYGMPEAILGRMVTTAPGQIAWLTHDELVSAGTFFFLDSLRVDDRRGSTPEMATTGDVPPQVTAPIFPTPSQAGSFSQGLSDRKDVEAWIDSLSKDGKAGAEFWAGQRSLRRPGSCLVAPDPAPENFAAWTSGCVSAQQRFAPTDIRRKSDLSYKAGWNSLSR